MKVMWMKENMEWGRDFNNRMLDKELQPSNKKTRAGTSMIGTKMYSKKQEILAH